MPYIHACARSLAKAVCACALLPAVPAIGQDTGELAALINEFRDSPQQCAGQTMGPVGPLAPDPALAGLQIDAGTRLQDALEDAGYQARRAEAIGVSGPSDPKSAMSAIGQRYCRALLGAQYASIGVSRDGNKWTIVLAQPLISPDLGDWRDAGKDILKLANEARARARTCGNRRFPAAPPLAWNDTLGEAALAHSRDMAKRNYFRHEGQDGSSAGDRARREGYDWRSVGENIATGQGKPKEVVSGWLSSPGHCANIMNGDFTEMGAAYAVNPDSDTTIYWTQVFGTPR